MPEGPEIYILAKILNKNNIIVSSYGKHLYIKNEDWSFGLNGRIRLKNRELVKIETECISGSIKKATSLSNLVENNKLGIDFMTVKQNEINEWKTSRRQLGILLLDQNKIAGIGVAWGSEILFKAKLKPDIPARDQNLSNLVDTIIFIRNNIRNLYNEYIETQNFEAFVNNWFRNLYKIRHMNIYGKGKIIKVSNRNWWIGLY